MAAVREQNDRNPSVVLALPDSSLATAAAERLRRDGWQVWRAAAMSMCKSSIRLIKASLVARKNRAGPTANGC